MSGAIDTILLDLGGVLIDVDYERTARAFKDLGCTDFDGLYSKARQTDLFDRFETGELGAEAFRDELRRLCRKDLTDPEIDTAWNAMLGSIPAARISLVERLRQRYRVLLLSNTNAIHVPAFTEIVRRESGITDFKGIFHGAYYSCEIGLRKPDADAYLHVLGRHGARPGNTLFIDDSPQHVDGAWHTGLRAEHLDLAREDLVGLVGRLGLL
ncbi:MAG: HAD family phosphatase [Flavobacteriales bacterium]|nr:HAD family phosphatase [Flavobacteriales bacterium]